MVLDCAVVSRWKSVENVFALGFSLFSWSNTVPQGETPTMANDMPNRMTNMVDAVGTNSYTYTAGGQLLTDDGPFASDTVTNT
jgi:hypothetical protein